MQKQINKNQIMKKNEKRLKYLIWSKDNLTSTFCSLQQEIDIIFFHR